jgi:CHAT domain-containing protein
MANRFAPDKNMLGKLVRQRQDAVEQWRAIDSTLTERLGGVNSQSVDHLEQKLKTKLNSLTDKIKQLDKSLRSKFPEFAQLTNPRPVELNQVQKLLKADEALFLHVTGSQGSDLFLVRRDKVRVSRTQMNALDLKEAVESVRKGFDLSKVEQLSDLPYFDTDKAYYLYQNLFYPLRNDLKDVKHIIVVLDGAMQNLPPTVLLSSPAKGSQKNLSYFSQMDFSGRDFSFSVLPSVSSFKALRSDIKASGASKPFVGFGDPNFEGEQSNTRGVVADKVEELVTHIDPATLRSLFVPLPETRDELEALAKILKATARSLFFREEATESVVKNTDLSQYSVIVFATHGLLAGEFRGLAEPALVLTPPKKATNFDDGLFTASEIAKLKLDSDWVILSACNTAGPAGRPGAEGLSGLAKAFFYAGTRALLVSHWAVASDASVLLTTGAVKAFADNPKIGRADALRQAILVLLNQEAQAHFAHPAFWAPFITVGEGGGF